MKGVICKRHVLSHPLTIIQSFGWQVFLRALTAGRDQTFLSIVTPALMCSSAPAGVAAFIERCVALEVRAAEVYAQLSQRYGALPPVSRFFTTLSGHEQGHAELLEFCRGLASESCWLEENVAEWRGAVPRLEDKMTEVESGLDQLTDPEEALRLVIEIEGSEINNLFNGVVSATDNEFVRNFQAFQNAEKEHLDFICDEIPKLEIDLADACTELRSLHR
jgi:hypothetical protein